MNDKKYLVLTEDNEWEGESWNFYIKSNENNIKCFECIKKILEENDSFSFREVSLTKEQIKELPNNCHYMHEHNVIDEDLDYDKLNKIKKYEDEFYKGGIKKYIKNEKE